MECVAVGDLHLSDASGVGGLSKYVENSDEVILSEVDKVLVYAKEHSVQNVVFLGDICDGPRMSYDANLLLLKFLKLNSDFMFYLYTGNHDLFSSDPAVGHSLQLLREYRLPNVKIITKPQTIDIDGAQCRFLPFPHMSLDAKALNFAHKEVYGSKNDHGRVNKNEELSKSKAVACIGHLHTAHQVRNCYYPGTLYQTNFGEPLPKYFHHITFNSFDDHEISLIETDPTYKLHTIVVNSKADLASIPKGKTNLIKLVIADGADVVAGDYANLKNIEMVKAYKNKEELAAVLTEDLSEGQALIIRTDEFFKDWLKGLDVDREMRTRVRDTRTRILNSVT